MTIATLARQLTLLALAASVALADGLTPEHYVELRRAGSVTAASDGTCAYVLSVPGSADDEPGTSYRQIWVVQNEQARLLTREKGKAGSPQFNPTDPTQLLFLDQRDDDHDKTQVYTISINGGEARPLTEHETGVSSFRLAHDGKTIAFTASHIKTEEEQDDEDAGRDWKIIGDDRPKRLWIDDGGEESRLVYEGSWSINRFEWMPDGSALVVQASPTSAVDDQMMFSRLYTVSAAGGDLKPICATEGKLGSMAISPNGKTLAYCGAVSLNDPLPQTVFTVDLPSGQPDTIPFENASAVQVAWAQELRLLILLNAGTETRLIDYSMAGQFRTTLPVIATSFALADNRIAVVGSTQQSADTLFLPFLNNLKDAKFRPVKDHNPQLTDVELAYQETIQWKSVDGLEIEGVLTYPHGYTKDRKYPIILNPHGGPEGVSQNGWNPMAQMLATRGYLVLQPNYRGSGGRGVAHSKGDHDDLGGLEFEDIKSGLQHLVDEGIADPQRVGIGGWSYGGYLSALAATHHTEIFKAAVMGAGISNWVSFSGTTDIPHEMSLVHWNRYLYDNMQLFWDRSPLSRIQQARTPTLILHGSGDDRVHPGQAYELYTALKIREIPTQLVIYPRSGHGVSEREHRIDMYNRQLDWFDRYVK